MGRGTSEWQYLGHFHTYHESIFSTQFTRVNQQCSLWLHTHTRLTTLCPGLPGWAGTRKEKPVWILLKQETVSGSGISWAICKSAPRSRQITTPAPPPPLSFFTGRMPFLPPNQQRQSTEGSLWLPVVEKLAYLFVTNVCACMFVLGWGGG